MNNQKLKSIQYIWHFFLPLKYDLFRVWREPSEISGKYRLLDSASQIFRSVLLQIVCNNATGLNNKEFLSTYRVRQLKLMHFRQTWLREIMIKKKIFLKSSHRDIWYKTFNLGIPIFSWSQSLNICKIQIVVFLIFCSQIQMKGKTKTM